jgi:calnexin
LVHLYTLIVRPDNSVEILIDGNVVKQANLLTDFKPPVNPTRLIDDPDDKKPEDWVDDEEIDDPDAEKPEEWDDTQPEFLKDPTRFDPPPGWLVNEPKLIHDPDAVKPEEWVDSIHGEWEAPLVLNPLCENAPGCGPYEPPLLKNPDYKGRWKPPKIRNPAYKGPFRPRQIQNPNYYEDRHPHNFEPLIGAGFELWMVSRNVAYGNVYIGNDEAAAKKWNKAHFIPKLKLQHKAKTKLDPTPDTAHRPFEGPGFSDGLKEFGDAMSKAWKHLFEENQVATLGLTLLILIGPIGICCCVCGKKAPPPRTRKRKVIHKKSTKKDSDEKPRRRRSSKREASDDDDE